MTTATDAQSATSFSAERREDRHARLLARFGGPVPGLPGDGTPTVLHVDTERSLTYTWHDQSPRLQDIGSRESGFLVSRLSVAHDGIEVAYLNITSTTPELLADTFASPFEWACENTGACFGFERAREEGREVSPERIWAVAYSNLGMTPPSAAHRRSWGSYAPSEAPSDPSVLAAELAVVEKVYAKQMRAFARWLSTPFVDYSHVDDDFDADRKPGHPGSLRRTGVGRTMYVLAARHLAATRGKVLRASGCQTDHAQGLWAALHADPALPTRATRVTFYKPTATPTQTYLCLDYTKDIRR